MSTSVSDLDPREGETGRNDQAQKLYLQRVNSFQTGVPPEILVDWFQEQPGTAVNWGFLDLKNISWTVQSFAISEVPGAEVFKGGAQQMARLVKDISWERQWVYKIIERDGTWPKPPILLRTENMQYLAPPGIEMQKPLHLAEGYHRVAALHALRQKGAKLADEHKFWVGSPIASVVTA